MTTVTSLAAQSIGTGANTGNDLFPTKVTLSGISTGLCLSARITNGAGGSFDQRAPLEILYAISHLSVAAAAAVELFKEEARFLSMRTTEVASADRYKNGLLEPIVGGYLYFWCNVPLFNTAAVLNVYVTEL